MFDRDFNERSIKASTSSQDELSFVSLWEEEINYQELQHLAFNNDEDAELEFTPEGQDDPPRPPRKLLVADADNPLPELEKIQTELQKGAKASDLLPRLDALLQLSLKTVGNLEAKYNDIRQRLGNLVLPENPDGAGYRAYIASLQAQDKAYSAYSDASDAFVARRTSAIIQAYIRASTGIDNPAGGQFPPLSKEDFDLLLDMSLNDKKREEILAKLKRAEVRDRRLTPEGQPLLSKLVENYHATAKAWKDSIEEIKTKFAALAANVREDIAHHEELAPIMAAPRDTRILYLRVLSTAMRQSTDDTATVQMLTKSQQLRDELQRLGFGPTGERLKTRLEVPERLVSANTDGAPEPPPQTTTYPENLNFYNDPLMLHHVAGELVILHKCKFGPQVMKIMDMAIDSADRINVKAFKERWDEAKKYLEVATKAGDAKLLTYLNAKKEMDVAERLYEVQIRRFLRAFVLQEAAYFKAGENLIPPLSRADILVLVDPVTDAAAKSRVIDRVRAAEDRDPALKEQAVSFLMLGEDYSKAADRVSKAIQERQDAMQALPEELKTKIIEEVTIPDLMTAKVNLRISYIGKLNEAIAASRDAAAKQAMQERLRILTIELQRLGYLPDGRRLQLSSHPNIPAGLEIPPVKIDRPVKGQDGENPLVLLDEAMQLADKPNHRAKPAGPTNWELAQIKFWKALDLTDKVTPEQKQAEIARLNNELERIEAMIEDGKDRTRATTVDLTPQLAKLEQQKKKLGERIDLVTWLPFYARFLTAVAFCRNGCEDDGRKLLQEAKEGPRDTDHYELACRVLELLDIRPRVVLDDDTIFNWRDTSGRVSEQALRNLSAREVSFLDVLHVTSDASMRMRANLDVGEHLYGQALKAAETINREQVTKDIASTIEVLTKNQNPEDVAKILHPDQAVILRAMVIRDLERLLLSATVQESWAQSLSFACQFNSAANHLREAQRAALALTQSINGNKSVMQLVREEIERVDKRLKSLQAEIEAEQKKPIADRKKIATLKAEQNEHKEYKDALASMELRVVSPSVQLASLYQGEAIVPQAEEVRIKTSRAPDIARMKEALLAAMNADPVFKQNNELKNLLAWANAEHARKRSWVDTVADCGGIMAAIMALELWVSRGRSWAAGPHPTLRFLANPRAQQVLRFTAPFLTPSLAGGTVNWGIHAASGDFSHEWFIRGAGPNAVLGAGLYWGGVALNAYFGRALTAEAVGANLAARTPAEVQQMFINANLHVPPGLQAIVRSGQTWEQAAAATHGNAHRLIGELLTPGPLTAAGAGMARGRLIATLLRNPDNAVLLQGTELAAAVTAATTSRTGAALRWLREAPAATRARLPGTVTPEFNLGNAAAQYAAIRNTRWLIGSGQSGIFSVGNLTVRIHDQMQNPETSERYSIWHVPSWCHAAGSALSEYNPISWHGLRNILYDVAIGGAALSSTSIGPPAARERFWELSTVMPWNWFHLHARALPASWQRAFWNQYLSPVTSAFHYTLWQEFNYNIPAAVDFYDAVFHKPQPLRNDPFVVRDQPNNRGRSLRQHQKLPGWEPLPR